ncbi:zf-HC2 domain-containing protein [Streptomyces sp. NPDC019937]|uniref:zf-HC2 domain-containing protein n=1 Tax=Streptomyces sp. NPDC019937 TaxID=3154787 RepID=UPI0033EABB33
MTHAWHVTATQAASYADGSLPELDAWSVDKHLEACTPCAARVSAAARGGTAAPALAAVRTALLATATAPDGVPPVHPPPPRPLRPTGRARLAWAAGPALRGPWLVSLLVMAVGAVCAARVTGAGGVRPLLLLLAPVLPSLGVAVSYGRHADPMHEIVVSTPSGGLRLLLTRTAAVLAVSVPLLTLAGLLLPDGSGGPGAAAWLLPGLALTLAALALGSYVGCRAATGTVSAGWLLAIGAPAAAEPGGPPGSLPSGALADSLATVLSGPAAQGCWAAAAAGCAGLLVLRRTSYDRLERS